MPAGEQFRRYFPGLKPREDPVWRAYLREHELDFATFEYNVRVGDGLRMPPRVIFKDPEQQRKHEEWWLQLTQRKIDVLATRPGEVWIIEVEDRADSATLGQILQYELLLLKQRPVDVPTVKLVVAKRVGQDMLEAFDSQGVLVWLPQNS